VKISIERLAVLCAITWTGTIASVQAAAVELPVETVRHAWATPYQVQVEDANGGAVVSGKLRTSVANPGRRLYGKVRAEVLDRAGKVIGIYDAVPHRMSPAKHTHRTTFEIAIDRLPESAAGLRVGYR
jgi:hypothetical protein